MIYPCFTIWIFQGRHAPDLYDLYYLYDLYDLCDLAHAAGRKSHYLHDLGRTCPGLHHDL